MSNNSPDQKDKILELIREVIDCDTKLRTSYQIGDKFKFIRDRLTAVKNQLEQEFLEREKKEQGEKKTVVTEDDLLVYVSLYNAQGSLVKTWQNLLSPGVFYEYSVNRPIYASQKAIEDFIKAKKNQLQHAYITVAVNKNDILASPSGEAATDTLGNPVIKVREGSLKFSHLIAFRHNGNEYELNEAGELVKK